MCVEGNQDYRYKKTRLEVLNKKKEHAMRDSNPQPPDSKSDTLSIAPIGHYAKPCKFYHIYYSFLYY